MFPHAKLSSKSGLAIVLGSSFLVFVACKPRDGGANLSSRNSQDVERGKRADVVLLSISGKVKVQTPQDVQSSSDMEKAEPKFKLETQESACSGISICDRLVLTAAHCFDGYEKLQVLEINWANQPKRAYEIELAVGDKVLEPRVHIRDGYDENARDRWFRDLAVVVLKEPQPFSSYVPIVETDSLKDPVLKKDAQPTLLGYYRADQYEYSSVYGYGYGKTESDTDEPQSGVRNLRRAEMHFQKFSEGPKDESGNVLRKIQVSPGPSDQLICVGDSGGPLFQEKDGVVGLLGVTSSTSTYPIQRIIKGNSCLAASQAEFVVVADHKSWLEEKMKTHCGSSK